ncbi:MAG: glycosyltransferase [Ginsengibacter sp.]
MKKKILIIPSWYASINNPIVGSFFKEQARLLSNNGYDIKILYGSYHVIHKKKGIINKARAYIRSRLKKPLDKISLHTDVLLQDPPAYSFSLSVSNELEDQQLFAHACAAYLSAVQIIIESGWKPDILHAQSTLEAGIFASYLSEILNIPFLIIEHQVFLLNKYSNYKQQLILSALAKANKVGVVSEHQKKCVLMNQPNCDPSVIWNLVDEDNFKIAFKNSERPFTIVTITEPSPVKDHKTFFNAMKSLSLIDGDFHYIVIGNNSHNDISLANSDVFIDYSKKLGIDKSGTFYPYLNRNEIAEILCNCDVFVSTSIAETFGIAAREAMMCGLPVVTTACGGIEDSITPDTGIVVPIRNHEAIARAILSIRNSGQKYNPQKIRDFAIAQCGKKSFLRKMEDFYSS